MSHALQRHGRGIAEGFHGVTHRQATDCGKLVSALEGEEKTERQGLSRTEQIGLAVGLLVLLIGGAVAAGGG